jgi:hypothetical protein
MVKILDFTMRDGSYVNDFQFNSYIFLKNKLVL